MQWYQANELLIQQSLLNAILAGTIQVSMHTGMLSLLPIVFWGIGGFIAANIAMNFGATLLIVCIIAGAICFAAGALLSVLLVRLRGLSFAMATLAILLIVGSLALQVPSITGGALGLYGLPVKTGTGELVAAAIMFGFVFTNLERGASGRRLDLLRLDEAVASTHGIDVKRHRLAISSLTSSIAGVAGAMAALAFNSFSPNAFGFGRALLILTIVIVGGTHSWIGAYLGAGVLALAPVLFHGFDAWSRFAYGGLIIVVVLFMPGGLYGAFRRVMRFTRAAVGRRVSDWGS